MLNDRERVLKMRLLEKLIDSMDDYDASRMHGSPDSYEEPMVEEDMEYEEGMSPGKGMATVVEEKTIPAEEVGDYLSDKIETLGKEKEMEEDSGDEEEEDDLPPFLRRAREAKRERSRGK